MSILQSLHMWCSGEIIESALQEGETIISKDEVGGYVSYASWAKFESVAGPILELNGICFEQIESP